MGQGVRSRRPGLRRRSRTNRARAGRPPGGVAAVGASSAVHPEADAVAGHEVVEIGEARPKDLVRYRPMGGELQKTVEGAAGPGRGLELVPVLTRR